MKSRVLQFFLLLVLMVVLLTVLHFLRFGGLTGFAVLDGTGPPTTIFSNDSGFGNFSIITKNISTEGSRNIKFNYDRKLVNLGGTDEFKVEWYDGTEWNIVEQTGDNGEDSQQPNLNPSADDNADFQIRFECTAESENAYCDVSNILIIGNDIIAPKVNITSLQEGEILTINESLPLSFDITNTTSLYSCWYVLNSGNNVNVDCENVVNTVFNVSDGEYELILYANDSDSMVGSDSVNFRVVAEGVFLEISKPTGALSGDSWEGTAKYTAYGNDCKYRVNYVDDGVIKDIVKGAEGSIANCQGEGEVEFKVFDDDDYVFFLEAKNSSGVTESVSSEFSVDAFSGSSGSGDSGSDSESESTITGAVIAEKRINLQFSELGEVLVRRGEASTMNVEVENTGTGILKDCVLFSEGIFAAWVESNQVEAFNPGEKSNYEFSLSVPDDVEPGVYVGNLVVKCIEGEANKEIQVSVNSDSFGVEILDYERIGNTLRVNYTLEEFAGATHELVLVYELVDFEGIVRTTGQEEMALGVKSKTNNILEFDLPKDSFGEFDFRMMFDDGASVVATNTAVFLSSEGITGLAVSDTNRRVLSVLGVVILLGVAVFFAWRYYPKWGPEVKNFYDSKFGSKNKKTDNFIKLGF